MSPSKSSSEWQLWPLRERLGSILVACLLPVGVHYSQQLDGLKPFFTADKRWEPSISGVYWGLLQTTYTAPNLVIPLIAGALVDRCLRPASVCLLFLSITFVGEFLFACATVWNSFPLLYLGRFLSGSGEGCISLMSGAIIAHGFFAVTTADQAGGGEGPQALEAAMKKARARRRCLVLALGISELVHAVSNTMSTSLSVPITLYFDGNYSAALFVAWGWCGFSLLVGLFAYWNQEQLGLHESFFKPAPSTVSTKDPSVTAAQAGGLTSGSPTISLPSIEQAALGGRTSSGTSGKNNAIASIAEQAPPPYESEGEKPSLGSNSSAQPVSLALPEATLLRHPTNLAARALSRKNSREIVVGGGVFSGSRMYPSQPPGEQQGDAIIALGALPSSSIGRPSASNSPDQWPGYFTTEKETAPSPDSSLEKYSSSCSSVGSARDLAASPGERLLQDAEIKARMKNSYSVEEKGGEDCDEGGIDEVDNEKDAIAAATWLREFCDGSDGFWCVLLFHGAFCASRRLFGHVDVDFFVSSYHLSLLDAGYLAGLQSSGAIVMPLVVGLIFLRLQETIWSDASLSTSSKHGASSSPRRLLGAQDALEGVAASRELMGREEYADHMTGFLPGSLARVSVSSVKSLSTPLLSPAAGFFKRSSPPSFLNHASEQDGHQRIRYQEDQHAKQQVVAGRLKMLSLTTLIFCAIAMASCYLFYAANLHPVEAPVFVLMLVSGIEPTILKSLVPLTTVHIATAFGCFETLECLMKTLGGPAVGILRDEVGSYSIDILIFACILYVAAIAGTFYLFRWMKKKSK